ncbi:hypothetical protein [Streptomyces sp. enrichment culture]|uniref:hypothetical protein n=1 Tax=Streptomyces sp. enrichment culture TaxID=1795815 RepID=UPI003F5766AB
MIPERVIGVRAADQPSAEADDDGYERNVPAAQWGSQSLTTSTPVAVAVAASHRLHSSEAGRLLPSPQARAEPAGRAPGRPRQPASTGSGA